MKFEIITLFPDFFRSPLKESILRRAIEKGKIDIAIHNLRDFTHDKHHVVDDAPYGGGSGMVMKAGPLVEAIESLNDSETETILLTPRGERFNQIAARELTEKRRLILICGRYEGVDERVIKYVDKEISVGDFILTGGEIAALAIIDATARLIPGVLGCEESAKEESFTWDILEYPHYTRPRSFRGEEVPETLLSGNHELIRRWRRKEALRKTMALRPDLLDGTTQTDEDILLMNEIRKDG